MAVLIEVGGGVLLVLGVLTQVTAGLLFLEMLVAAYMSQWKLREPYLCVESKGVEIDLFYAAAALVLFVGGPGAWRWASRMVEILEEAKRAVWAFHEEFFRERPGKDPRGGDGARARS